MELKEWIDAIGQAAVSITSLIAAGVALVIANRQGREAVVQRRDKDLVYLTALIATINNRKDPFFALKIDMEKEGNLHKQLEICDKALQNIANYRNDLAVFNPANFSSAEAVSAFIEISTTIKSAEQSVKELRELVVSHIADIKRTGFIRGTDVPSFDGYNVNIKSSKSTLEGEISRLENYGKSQTS